MTLRAKKSLGQNFLKDHKTLDIMVEAVTPELPVLEVGPGKGALTRKLLDAGHTVTAIEKDDRLIEFLEQEFATQIQSGQFTLVHGDALEDTPESLGFQTEGFQVVANLPYYITGLYIRRTLESDVRPRTMLLLLQREVVDRIVARDGKESLLSISVKAFGIPRKLCNVAARHFTPRPKVDSAVLSIESISDKQFTDTTISDFFRVVKQGFSSKRKMLKNNLTPILKDSDIDYDTLLTAIQKSPTVRAEDLSISHWFTIASQL